MSQHSGHPPVPQTISPRHSSFSLEQTSCPQVSALEPTSPPYSSSSHETLHSEQLSSPQQVQSFLSLLQTTPLSLQTIPPQHLSQVPVPPSIPSIRLHPQPGPSTQSSTADQVLTVLQAETSLQASSTQQVACARPLLYCPQPMTTQHFGQPLQTQQQPVLPPGVRLPQWSSTSQQDLGPVCESEQDRHPQQRSVTPQHTRLQNSEQFARDASGVQESPQALQLDSLPVSEQRLPSPKVQKKSVSSSLMEELAEKNMRKFSGQQGIKMEAQLCAEQVPNPELDALLLSLTDLNLSKYRPHELLDKVTVLYNAAYKPSKALVFDHCFMAGLVFYKGYVLLHRDVRMTAIGQTAAYKPPHIAYDANKLPETIDTCAHDTIHNHILAKTELDDCVLELFEAPQVHRPLKLDTFTLNTNATSLSSPAGSTGTTVHQQADGRLIDVWFCAQMYELAASTEQVTGTLTKHLNNRFCSWFDEKQVRENPEIAEEWRKFLLLTFLRRRAVNRSLRQKGELEENGGRRGEKRKRE